MHDLASIRQEYLLSSLRKRDVNASPIIQFNIWFAEAINASVDDVNAFALSTVDIDNKPHSRIVLLKGMEDSKFVFYTNQLSSKGLQMQHNEHVAALFYWKELQRQIRIEGKASMVSAQDAEDYFSTRPYESQISAWASLQSNVLSSRDELEEIYETYKNKFPEGAVPKPPHWGGYKIDPQLIEFWQGRAGRLHDRIRYRMELGEWKIERLNP